MQVLTVLGSLLLPVSQQMPKCTLQQSEIPQLIEVLAGLPDERNAEHRDHFFYDH